MYDDGGNSYIFEIRRFVDNEKYFTSSDSESTSDRQDFVIEKQTSDCEVEIITISSDEDSQCDIGNTRQHTTPDCSKYCGANHVETTSTDEDNATIRIPQCTRKYYFPAVNHRLSSDDEDNYFKYKERRIAHNKVLSCSNRLEDNSSSNQHQVGLTQLSAVLCEEDSQSSDLRSYNFSESSVPKLCEDVPSDKQVELLGKNRKIDFRPQISGSKSVRLGSDGIPRAVFKRKKLNKREETRKVTECVVKAKEKFLQRRVSTQVKWRQYRTYGISVTDSRIERKERGKRLPQRVLAEKKELDVQHVIACAIGESVGLKSSESLVKESPKYTKSTAKSSFSQSTSNYPTSSKDTKNTASNNEPLATNSLDEMEVDTIDSSTMDENLHEGLLTSSPDDLADEEVQTTFDVERFASPYLARSYEGSYSPPPHSPYADPVVNRTPVSSRAPIFKSPWSGYVATKK